MATLGGETESYPERKRFETKKIKNLLGGTKMKDYKPCEVKVRFFVAEDVIKTSQTPVNGVTTDTFTNEDWWKEGGEV